MKGRAEGWPALKLCPWESDQRHVNCIFLWKIGWGSMLKVLYGNFPTIKHR